MRMKKACSIVLISILLIFAFSISANANSWGLRGDLLDKVSDVNTWNDYSTICKQAGDAAVMGSRYHNALMLVEDGKLKVYTTAVHQPGSPRDDVVSIENVYPVYDGQKELDYQRCMTLYPEGWLRLDRSAPDDVYRMTGRPHKSLPKMQFTFEDAGKINAEGERVIRLDIRAEDGTYQQGIEYSSWETVDKSYGMARLEDVNFDGSLDLVLTHALGASNFYAIVAPWRPEEGRFAEPIQDIRFCNYVLYPEEKIILSSEKDGAASYHDKAYSWIGGQLTLMGESIMENTGSPDLLKERVVKYFSDGAEWICWDDEYPIAWYDGDSRVWNERRETAMLIHGTRGHRAKVANVDWVNLRQQDNKQSKSIAKLTAGTEVEILSYGCGDDQGWIRVLVDQDGKSLTGYIWKTYLEEIR